MDSPRPLMLPLSTLVSSDESVHLPFVHIGILVLAHRPSPALRSHNMSSSGSGARGRRAKLIPNGTRRNRLEASAVRGEAARREQPRERRPSALTIAEPCTRARATGGALPAGRRHTRAFRAAGRAPREPPPKQRTEDIVRRGTRTRQASTGGRRARPRTRSATAVMRLRARRLPRLQPRICGSLP